MECETAAGNRDGDIGDLRPRIYLRDESCIDPYRERQPHREKSFFDRLGDEGIEKRERGNDILFVVLVELVVRASYQVQP